MNHRMLLVSAFLTLSCRTPGSANVLKDSVSGRPVYRLWHGFTRLDRPANETMKELWALEVPEGIRRLVFPIATPAAKVSFQRSTPDVLILDVYESVAKFEAAGAADVLKSAAFEAFEVGKTRVATVGLGDGRQAPLGEPWSDHSGAFNFGWDRGRAVLALGRPLTDGDESARNLARSWLQLAEQDAGVVESLASANDDYVVVLARLAQDGASETAARLRQSWGGGARLEQFTGPGGLP